jgi:hypothetical protein
MCSGVLAKMSRYRASPPNVEIFCLRFYCGQLVTCSDNETPAEAGLWTGKDWYFLGANKRGETEIGWHRHVFKIGININRHVTSWSVPGVFPYWNDRIPIFFSIPTIFIAMPESVDTFGGNKGPIELNKSGLSYISRLLSGSESKPQKNSLNTDSHKLEESNNDQKQAENQRIPIIRRFFEAISGLLIALSLIFWVG